MSVTRWVVGAVLLVGVVGLGLALRVYNSRPRYVPDADLLAELEAAELPEGPPPAAAAWPGWRGPARDGAVSAPWLSRQWGRGPRVVHRFPAGEGHSSFAARDGLAWTMVESDGEEAVVCYDLRAGSERWRRGREPGRGYDYGGPRATPAVDGDDLFALSSDGVLSCFGAADGAERWQADVGLAAPKWGFATSPLVDGPLVHLGLAAFDRRTGERRWLKEHDVVGYSSPVLATVGGVRQVICFSGTRLIGLTPDTGEELWSFPWATPFQVNAATPLVVPARVGGREYAYVFISSGYEKGCALVRVAREGGRFTARPVYESGELCAHFASPVRRGDHVYGLDEQRDLTCLELRTGRAVWRQRGFRKGSLIRADDALILLGESGNLALAEASPEGYKVLTMARPSRDRCWATPALVGGLLLIRDRQWVLALDVGR